MGVEKTERPSRKRATLVLAAALTLLAAVPATAAPSKAKAGAAGGAASLLKVWEEVWGWLTAVWGEQGHGIDPNGARTDGKTDRVLVLHSGSGEQGNGIDPNGGK